MSSRQMFINLPVRDLTASIAFWAALGFEFNPQFTDNDATCMVVGESAFVMLLTDARFKDFTTKPIADAHSTTEVITAVSAASRAEVEELVSRAFAAGATRSNEPMDYGFMYGQSFADLDGHLWEVIWMDPAATEPTSDTKES